MYILFDIGASKMRFARSDDLQSFGNPIIKKNPRNYMEAMVTIREIVDELSNGKTITAMAGGISGVFDIDKEQLTFSPNMTDWVGKSLVGDLKRMTGIKPQIFNDTQMGGLGEAVYGSGTGQHVVAYITASTGIGGSVIVDGKINSHKYSFEPGHQIIDYKDGATLEELIGGKNLEERFNKKPEDLDSKIWEEITRILSVGLYNTILHWAPDIVVIGGSLMHKVEIKDVRSNIKQILSAYPEVPEVVCSKLGDLNGLYGAMAYLQSK